MRLSLMSRIPSFRIGHGAIIPDFPGCTGYSGTGVRASESGGWAVPSASGALRPEPGEVARVESDQQRPRPDLVQFLGQCLRGLYLGVPASLGTRRWRGQADPERPALDLVGGRRRQDLPL